MTDTPQGQVPEARCQADKVAQYVGNVSREDGTELIESLLRRWKANRADIPAHYNPDLYEPPKEQT